MTEWSYRDYKILISKNMNNTYGKHVSHLKIENANITKLSSKIGQLVNLKCLTIYDTNLSELPREIGKLVQLEELRIRNSKIDVIPIEIGNLINLKKLYLHNANIKEIPKEIGNLVNLREFGCYCNNITSIPIEITNCRNLKVFLIDNDKIDHIPPQVQRWIERSRIIEQIYNDKQSVHNHNIQEGVSKSINYIMQFKPTLNYDTMIIHMLSNDLITDENKLHILTFCEDKTIHSTLFIRFNELLVSVYDFILTHLDEHKEELFKILDREIADSVEKCFTGRISRLINVINGYSENVKINISNAEQIGNIFILIKNKLEKEGRYTDELFREIIMKELVEERGYDETTINEWLSNI